MQRFFDNPKIFFKCKHFFDNVRKYPQHADKCGDNTCSTSHRAFIGALLDALEFYLQDEDIEDITNTASCGSQCYEKSDGSQDARRGSPDMITSQMLKKVWLRFASKNLTPDLEAKLWKALDVCHRYT